MEVVEDLESRPHAEVAEGAAWLQWRKVVKEKRKERGREEEEERDGRETSEG